MAAKSQEALADEAVEIIKAYLDRPRTERLRELAPIIVDLRAGFSLADGRTDWSGRSPEYRRLMSDVYERARLPADQQDTFQSALRYHVGNLLRERAAREELAEVGLTPVAPKERIERARAVLEAQKAVAAPSDDVARLAAYAQALLEFIDVTVIPDLPPERAEAARLALAEVQVRASELLVRIADAQRRQAAGSGKSKRRGGSAGV
jgi:hypothetical protein